MPVEYSLTLHVYELTNPKSLLSNILGAVGHGIFHSGVEIARTDTSSPGIEYAFGGRSQNSLSLSEHLSLYHL